MTIIKDDIVNNVMKKIKIDRNTARNLVESILRNIKNTLASGDRVMISGFGEFKVRHKKARIGRNPKTKLEHEISERKVVTFQPSKILRKATSTHGH
jgi:integration host factor subunit alpha